MQWTVDNEGKEIFLRAPNCSGPSITAQMLPRYRCATDIAVLGISLRVSSVARTVQLWRASSFETVNPTDCTKVNDLYDAQ